jgi:hypothetical protein
MCSSMGAGYDNSLSALPAPSAHPKCAHEEHGSSETPTSPPAGCPPVGQRRRDRARAGRRNGAADSQMASAVGPQNPVNIYPSIQLGERSHG